MQKKVSWGFNRIVPETVTFIAQLHSNQREKFVFEVPEIRIELLVLGEKSQ